MIINKYFYLIILVLSIESTVLCKNDWYVKENNTYQLDQAFLSDIRSKLIYEINLSKINTSRSREEDIEKAKMVEGLTAIVHGVLAITLKEGNSSDAFTKILSGLYKVVSSVLADGKVDYSDFDRIKEAFAYIFGYTIGGKEKEAKSDDNQKKNVGIINTIYNYLFAKREQSIKEVVKGSRSMLRSADRFLKISNNISNINKQRLEKIRSDFLYKLKKQNYPGCLNLDSDFDLSTNDCDARYKKMFRGALILVYSEVAMLGIGDKQAKYFAIMMNGLYKVMSAILYNSNLENREWLRLKKDFINIFDFNIA